MARARSYLSVTRLQFSVASIIPFAIGTAWAMNDVGRINIVAAALCFVSVLSCQLMANVANDYWDREGDRFTSHRRFSGGSGMIQKGALSSREVLTLALLLATLSGSLSLIVYIAFSPGILFLLVAATGLFISWFYSAPPIRLVSAGLGEVSAAGAIAIMVPFIAYTVQTNSFSPSLMIATILLFPFLFLVMLAIHFPDYRADIFARKKNLVVRIGIKNAIMLMFLVLSVPYLLSILILTSDIGFWVHASVLLTVPLMIPFIGHIRNARTESQRERLTQSSVLLACSAGLAEFLFVSFQAWTLWN